MTIQVHGSKALVGSHKLVDRYLWYETESGNKNLTLHSNCTIALVFVGGVLTSDS